MSNIEDDVKIVKRYLRNSSYKESDSDFFKNGGWEMVDLEIPKAMANILSEREQDKARIKELEEERQLVGMPVKNKRSGKIGIVLHQWESGSIAVLENISPRIINTHDSWNTLEIINDEIKQIKTGSDSIPKQKAKEMQARIKELEEDLYSANKIINEYLDGIPKQKVKDILNEIQEEYNKLEEQFDCIWDKKSKDNYDRYKLQELSAMQQELGFIIGKFEELLEEGE